METKVYSELYLYGFIENFIMFRLLLAMKASALFSLVVKKYTKKFLDINYLDEVIYLIMTGIESDIVSADDIRDLIGDNLGNNSNIKKIFYDMPLKEARDLFEKEYFEYHIANNSSISEIAKIADVERTHLYRKLKQLGLKTK